MRVLWTAGLSVGRSYAAYPLEKQCKRDNLVVRQFERQENYEVSIILDLTEPKPNGTDPKTAQQRMQFRTHMIDVGETAIELAATMTREILRQHTGQVNFAIADGKSNAFFRVLTLSQMASLLNRLAVTNLTNKSRFIKVAEDLLLSSSPRNPTIILSLQSREESGIDQLPVVMESAVRAQSIRWIDVRSDSWRQYFHTEVDDEE